MSAPNDPEAAADALALEAELAAKMEALIAKFTSEPKGKGHDPRSAAEQLVEQAYEEEDPQVAVELVQQALVLHADCTMAYLHLADLAEGPEEAARWLTQAVESGERELGGGLSPKVLGSFGQSPAARDSLRARQRLGETLWQLQRHDHAVEHFKELLKLNPRDHQGIRYILAAALLELGRDADAEALLNAYAKDDSAAWEFQRTLLAFRREGDTVSSRNQFQKAKTSNTYIVLYLTGIKARPRNRWNWNGSDLEFEALDYVEQSQRAWESTPGAIDWLRTQREGLPAPTGLNP